MRQDLASVLGVEAEQVRQWYSNRRRRLLLQADQQTSTAQPATASTNQLAAASAEPIATAQAFPLDRFRRALQNWNMLLRELARDEAAPR